MRVLLYAGSSCAGGARTRLADADLDIAAATHIQMSTVSRQISRLLDQGLVERVDDVQGDDARHRWVRPTAAGSAYLRELVELRDSLVRENVVDVLGEEDFLELGRLFKKLAQNTGQ